MPVSGSPPHDDPARLDEARGEIDAAAVDPAEPAQGEAFALDAVLRADHGEPLPCRSAACHRPDAPVVESRDGVLRLDGEHEDVARLEFQCRRAVGDGEAVDAGAVRGGEGQPVLAQSRVLRPSGDQDHLVARLGQSSAYGAAHGARSHDDVAHAREPGTPPSPAGSGRGNGPRSGSAARRRVVRVVLEDADAVGVQRLDDGLEERGAAGGAVAAAARGEAQRRAAA